MRRNHRASPGVWRASALLVSALLAGGMAGCLGKGSATPGPRATTDALSEAIRSDDPARAYALLSERVRASTPWDQFRTHWKQHRAELHALGEALDASDDAGHAVAYVSYTERGDPAVLVLEEGRWYLDGTLLGWGGQASPLEALLALRRALLHAHHQRMLQRLSAARRAPLEALGTHLLEHTEDPLTLDVEELGDQAIIYAKNGVQIHMRREAGRWRVHDVTEGGSPK